MAGRMPQPIRWWLRGIIGGRGKAPFTVNGHTLWVGAATHDIGFEKTSGITD